MEQSILTSMLQSKHDGRRQLAVLLDPGKLNTSELTRLVDLATHAGVDYFFVGGSLVVRQHLTECLKVLQDAPDIPKVLFPGSAYQLDGSADAVLFLSLLSGRNPEYLIGQQVLAAPMVAAMELEAISCAYLLIDGNRKSSVEYISNTQPLPRNKADLAQATALAGSMMGMSTIYLDAGSGAKDPVPVSIIQQISNTIPLPLIVGGGIRDTKQAFTAMEAGADVIVIGNAFEENPELLQEMSITVHSFSRQKQDF